MAGDATVEMQFAAADVNDLLKSMVVLDHAGGPPTVSYASRDPVTKTLGTSGCAASSPTAPRPSPPSRRSFLLRSSGC